MKKIEATIVRELLVGITEALVELGFGGVNSSEVEIVKKDELSQCQYWEHNLPPHNPRIKIEIVANDDQVDLIIKAIQRVAKENNCHQNDREFGNSIFILPIEEVIRIRTGETGNNAI